MTFVSVSTWNTPDGPDREDARARLRDEFFPTIKALGALRQTAVETSETEAVIISEWPDEETRAAAMQKIAQIRATAKEQSGALLKGEVTGNVFAQL